MQKKVDYKKQGRRNKINGANFERKVRTDLESKGWIVSKWQNNVEFADDEKDSSLNKTLQELKEYNKIGKCIPAKPGRFRMMQTGFPDFIAYKEKPISNLRTYEVIFVECKTNGYLSKEEKEKADWYLKSRYCGKFFIAKKIKVGRRVEVEYNEYNG